MSRDVGRISAFVVPLLFAVACSGTRNIKSALPNLKMGMAKEEVLALAGEPTFREAWINGSHVTDYWSYLVAQGTSVFHLSRQPGEPPDTYECLTFVDDHLTEWVRDVGEGGHSSHPRQ